MRFDRGLDKHTCYRKCQQIILTYFYINACRAFYRSARSSSRVSARIFAAQKRRVREKKQKQICQSVIRYTRSRYFQLNGSSRPIDSRSIIRVIRLRRRRSCSLGQFAHKHTNALRSLRADDRPLRVLRPSSGERSRRDMTRARAQSCTYLNTQMLQVGGNARTLLRNKEANAGRNEREGGGGRKRARPRA